MQREKESKWTKLWLASLGAAWDDERANVACIQHESTSPHVRSVFAEPDSGRARTARPCLHALAGRVVTRDCTQDYQCESCDFDQLVEKTHIVYPRQCDCIVDVEGFRYSDHYHYHQGHSWAHTEYQGKVRIGLDDFASSIIGCPDAVELPPLGSRISPGAPAFALRRDRHWVNVLSPIQGTILAVNEAVLEHPELVRTDPFRDGWLVVAKPDATTAPCDLLLQGKEANDWLVKECRLLRVLLSGGLGSRPANGGNACEQRMLISEWAWIALVETFLRSPVQIRG